MFLKIKLFILMLRSKRRKWKLLQLEAFMVAIDQNKKLVRELKALALSRATLKTREADTSASYYRNLHYMHA